MPRRLSRSARLLVIVTAALALVACNRRAPGPSAGSEPAGGIDTAVSVQSVHLAGMPAEFEGAFAVWDEMRGVILAHNPDRLDLRLLPASTFKIPNSVIALETGVADGPDFSLRWDSVAVPRQPWWPPTWARDQTMRTALPNSVVWYYQELARRIGPEDMQVYLDRFGYGNRDLSGGIDLFWLTGGLRISPREQLDFLRRLYAGRLGISERTTDILKELLVLEEGPDYRLSGKTGTGDISDSLQVAWLVGWLERGEAVYPYALNLVGAEINQSWPPGRRKDLVRALLQELGLIPTG